MIEEQADSDGSKKGTAETFLDPLCQRSDYPNNDDNIRCDADRLKLIGRNMDHGSKQLYENDGKSEPLGAIRQIDHYG